MKKLSFFALLIQILFLISCSKTTPLIVNNFNLEDKILKVGITTNYPPVIFRYKDKNAGIEIDLARKISNYADISIIFVEVEWDRLIPSLLNEEIDIIMSGMSVTEDRKQIIDFTEPYMQIGQMVLIRNDEINRLSPISKIYLDNSRVGYELDTTGEQFVKSRLISSVSLGYKSVEDGLGALDNGYIDYFIHDAPTIWKYTLDKNNNNLVGLYTPLTEEYLAWGVRKDDQELLKVLNSIIKKLKEDGSIQEIINKWIPISIKTK